MESVSRMEEHSSTRISVVIPAHNEEKNLQYILPYIPHWIHEVILINDHSTDKTGRVFVLSTQRVVAAKGRRCRPVLRRLPGISL